MSEGTLLLRVAILAVALVAAAGCWNSGSNTTVHLGDVSVGQQLIDLQTAREHGAISDEEHQQLKLAIMALAAGCESDG